jgi:hypothetical protein
MNFDTIKRNYDRGLWTAAMVKIAVKKGVITHDEYEAITSVTYGDTPEEVQAMLTAKVQKYLDTTAQKLGYDSCLSVCSYVDTGVAKFDEEGEAFRKWRSAVWAKGYEIVAQVQASTRPIPTEEELFAELPAIALGREELKE